MTYIDTKSIALMGCRQLRCTDRSGFRPLDLRQRKHDPYGTHGQQEAVAFHHKLQHRQLATFRTYCARVGLNGKIATR